MAADEALSSVLADMLATGAAGSPFRTAHLASLALAGPFIGSLDPSVLAAVVAALGVLLGGWIKSRSDNGKAAIDGEAAFRNSQQQALVHEREAYERERAAARGEREALLKRLDERERELYQTREQLLAKTTEVFSLRAAIDRITERRHLEPETNPIHTAPPLPTPDPTS